MGGCRVGEVQAGTTSPMPDHKGVFVVVVVVVVYQSIYFPLPPHTVKWILLMLSLQQHKNKARTNRIHMTSETWSLSALVQPDAHSGL